MPGCRIAVWHEGRYHDTTLRRHCCHGGGSGGTRRVVVVVVARGWHEGQCRKVTTSHRRHRGMRDVPVAVVVVVAHGGSGTRESSCCVIGGSSDVGLGEIFSEPKLLTQSKVHTTAMLVLDRTACKFSRL